MTYKGVVKGNMVILEEGVHLPNGATVVVILEHSQQEEGEAVTEEELSKRQALVTRMKEFGQKLTGRNVTLGDLILEAKEELENRA
ncbi:MAG: hypothetical protein HYZ72_10540 [Deltaproteobacteria bacterium]|jgi:hypothetical protein|nr:hypothetical protein [Deltaproteobacteria bacterium]